VFFPDWKISGGQEKDGIIVDICKIPSKKKKKSFLGSFRFWFYYFRLVTFFFFKLFFFEVVHSSACLPFLFLTPTRFCRATGVRLHSLTDLKKKKM
jgi:hypothetical protein